VRFIGVIKEAFDKQHFILQADLCPSRPHGVFYCYTDLRLTVKMTARTKLPAIT
jgi:anaerobic selenocysteine-containing dehydrogenase